MEIEGGGDGKVGGVGIEVEVAMGMGVKAVPPPKTEDKLTM